MNLELFCYCKIDLGAFCYSAQLLFCSFIVCSNALACYHEDASSTNDSHICTRPHTCEQSQKYELGLSCRVCVYVHLCVYKFSLKQDRAKEEKPVVKAGKRRLGAQTCQYIVARREGW